MPWDLIGALTELATNRRSESIQGEAGHINVKQREDKSLYRFCVDMRRARNKSEKSTVTLTDDRIAILDALGFEF